jgi:hypothetical protein
MEGEAQHIHSEGDKEGRAHCRVPAGAPAELAMAERAVVAACSGYTTAHLCPEDR